MIELDVDMGYLLEEGEPDCVTLNDENGEFEPMTFYRGDTDAVDFCKRVESAVRERKPLELFGVNYEAVGDEPFCETVNRWLNGDAPQECRECPDGKYAKLTVLVDSTTRWHELFGTPERAARTLIMVHEECESVPCSPICPFGDAPACPSNFESSDYDVLLGWLGGDAE